ncbi:MAG: M20/M25/M40 family metallo-hydrolase [Sphingomonadales bacterium]
MKRLKLATGQLLLIITFSFLSLGIKSSYSQNLTPEKIRGMAAAQIDKALKTYHDLLSIPNDTHNQDNIRVLVGWLNNEFGDRGFRLETLETETSPLVLATRLSKGATKTALIYLQADGQPVDPSLWFQENPYTPTLKAQNNKGEWNKIEWSSLNSKLNPDWRIFARSAVDSKGPITQFLTALDALDQEGVPLGFNLKVIIDTEEENGSPSLPKAVIRHKEKLKSDFLLIFDGPPHASNKPTIKFGARGIATITLKTHGPIVPQHSGHYGNYVPNPAFALAKILASMKSKDGRVTIPNFYDGVKIDEATLKILDAVPDDIKAIHKHLGIAQPDKVAESLQLAVQYPSINIRGLSSLKVGAESRTLVPATAIAEIDVRLVKESDPKYLIKLIRDHITKEGYNVLDHEPTMEERLTLPYLVTFTSIINYGAFRTDFNSEPGLIARAGMKNLYGEEPILIRTSGGSIPISPFVEILGIPAVSVPTVNIDNNQHAPNENIRLGNFIEGISILISVLGQKTSENIM